MSQNKEEFNEISENESGQETTEASDSEATETTGVPHEELSTLMEKLDEATRDVTAHKERYLRTVADLENYRKRALREKEEARKQATFGLLEDIIPALDNFKLGLQSAEAHEGGKAFAEGFKMIFSQMESALKQNGLEEINPDGAMFDPNFHESISHIPSNSVAEGHVVEVHRIGYKIRERLLRPAQVVVSSGAPGTSETGDEKDPTEDQ